MKSSDIITAFLMEMLDDCGGNLEIRRNELAHRFNVVPSQINYVISSRFTPELGFLIESRRGGGGYIKISRVQNDSAADIMHIINNIGDTLNAFDARIFLRNMEENGYISSQTRALMSAASTDKAYACAAGGTGQTAGFGDQKYVAFPCGGKMKRKDDCDVVRKL